VTLDNCGFVERTTDGQRYRLLAVSAPVLNAGGEAVAMVSIPGPKSRLTPERVEEIAQAVIDARQSARIALLPSGPSALAE
jgi:hypothetical protein